MDSYQNSARSLTEARSNNAPAASLGELLPRSDPAEGTHLIDETLRTQITDNPRMIVRPAALGPPLDLSSLEYVEEYSHNLMCAICHSPFVRPLRLPCQHVFCQACFLDVRNSHPQGESCPTCREKVRPERMSSIPKIVELILDDLIVKCPFSDNGCTEQMSRCLAQDHVDKYCEYIQVKCPYDNCGEEIQRRHLNDERCHHKLILCVTCDRSYKEIDFSSHCATHDDERIVPCPSCATTVLGRDLQSHESSCPEAAVSCVAATYGCDHICKRASIDDHNTTCPLAKLSPFLALQSSRLAQQELALKNLRHKNALLETTFEKIQEFFTSLSVPTQVTTGGQLYGVEVTFSGIASLILDMYHHQKEDLNLAKAMADLGQKVDTLSDAHLVNSQIFNNQLLHTNRHVNVMEREVARLKRELSSYQQGTRVPESAAVATLGVSGLGSSVSRASEDAMLVTRLIPDFGVSRAERARTALSDRHHSLSSIHPPLSNTRSLPIPGTNETHPHRSRAGLRRLSPFSASWSPHWPGLGRRQAHERSQAQGYANGHTNENRTTEPADATTGEPSRHTDGIPGQHPPPTS